MHKANLAVALMFVGGAAFVGLARADKPSPISQAQPAVKLADEPVEVQHLREARKHLQEAKDAFEKDPVDRKDHRKAILKGIDDSIAEVDAEIDELLGK